MRQILHIRPACADWRQTPQTRPILPAGVYIIGCQRVFSQDNNIVIARMADGSEGAQWGTPVQLTRGLSVITINTGVDVSAGKVTKAFEMIPR